MIGKGRNQIKGSYIVHNENLTDEELHKNELKIKNMVTNLLIDYIKKERGLS